MHTDSPARESRELRPLPADFRLLGGGHDDFAEGACLLEAVAYVAGEAHSDHPQCACPVLAAYGRALNDALKDDERQRLAPLIPRLVGTASTPEVELRRAFVF